MNGCIYQPYLFMYRTNDLKPEMEIQKLHLDNRLGSRRVEDAKEVNLNTILIKLKCENTHHNMDCIQLAHPTQLCYFNSVNLLLSVWFDTYTFSFESISVFLSTLISRIYKWDIQILFGFLLLFLLSRTENLCSLIFLYILMFYQDHRKYYKGYYGKLKLNICFQSLRGQFYTLRVLCWYNSEYLLQSFSTKKFINMNALFAINTQRDISYHARLKNKVSWYI